MAGRLEGMGAMNTTAMRDELARVCGWHVPDSADPYWERDGHVQHKDTHPFPDGDLNALAAVWPEGWQIEIEGPGHETGGEWHAGATSKEGHWKSFHAPTEYAARLALTLEVLKAGKGAGDE
jgi:hypothetical protein